MTPTAIPPATERTKTEPTSASVMLPAASAVMATLSMVRPVPSLTSASPSRIDTSRRGIRTLFATELSATASVGARIAPSATAMANGRATTDEATKPTTIVDAITRTTASITTGRLTRRKSMNEEPRASPKTSGASTNTRMTSGSGMESGP